MATKFGLLGSAAFSAYQARPWEEEEDDILEVDLTEEQAPGGLLATALPEEEEEIVISSPPEKPRSRYESPDDIYRAIRNGTFNEDEFWAEIRGQAPQDEELPAEKERTAPSGEEPDQELIVDLREIVDAAEEPERELEPPQLSAPPITRPAEEAPRELTAEERENPRAVADFIRRQAALNRNTEAAERAAEEAAPESREAREVTPGDLAVRNWINSEEGLRATVDQIVAQSLRIYEEAGEAARDPNVARQSAEGVVRYRQQAARIGVVPRSIPVQPTGQAREMTREELKAENERSVVESMQAGAAIARQLTWAALEAGGEVTGADSVARFAGERREANRALLEVMPQGTRMEDIEGLGDALAWVKNAFFEQVPLMAAPMGGAVVGGIIRGSVGARLGAFGPAWVLGTGEVQSQNKEINPEQQAGLATFVGGTAIAALDTITPSRLGSMLVGRFGREAAEDLSMRMLLMPASERILAAARRTGTEGVRAAGTEFPTEALQTAIGEVATAFETNTPIRPGLLFRMFESGMTGAVAGGGFGVTAGAVAEAAGPTRRDVTNEIRDAQFDLPADEVARKVQSPSQRRGDVTPITGEEAETARTVRDARATNRPMLLNGEVTSRFGPRRSFRTQNGQMASSQHMGVDVARPAGTFIPAMVDGRVMYAGPRGGLGIAVAIRGANGHTYWAGHMQVASVEVGTEVRQGQVIGRVGQTGNASGPHVHYAVRDRNGNFLDPLSLRPNRGTVSGGVEGDIEVENVPQIEEPDTDLWDTFNESEEGFALEQARFDEIEADMATAEAERETEVATEQARTRAVEAPTVEAAIEEIAAAPIAPSPIAEVARQRIERLASEAPQPNEEPVFRQDPESGLATEEVVAFRNLQTGEVRPLNPAAEAPALASQGQEASGLTRTAEIAETASTGRISEPLELTVRQRSPQELTEIGVLPEEGEFLYGAQTREAVDGWINEASMPVVRQSRQTVAEIVRPDLMGISQEQADERLASIIGNEATAQAAIAEASEGAVPGAVSGVGPAIPDAPAGAVPRVASTGSPQVIAPITSGETLQLPSEFPSVTEINQEADRLGLKGGPRADFLRGTSEAIAGIGPEKGLSKKRTADRAVGAKFIADRRKAYRLQTQGSQAPSLSVISKKMRRGGADGARHEVTLSDGTTVTMYRDTDQFGPSNAQWYVDDELGDDRSVSGTQWGLGDSWLGTSMQEALENLPRKVATVRANRVENQAAKAAAPKQAKTKRPKVAATKDMQFSLATAPAQEVEQTNVEDVSETEARRLQSAGPSSERKGRDAGRRLFVSARLGRASGGETWAYAKAGGSTAARLRGVSETFEPTPDFRDVAQQAGLAAPTVNELASTPANTERFAAALTASAKGSKYGAAVYVYPQEEYAGMRLFLSEDGKAGFAIKEDGDIVSVFSPGGGQVHALLSLATEQGGTKLDAFDTVLPDIYRVNGFREVARVPWNEEYIPDGWDKKTFADFNNGEPDVVFMEYDPAFSPFDASWSPERVDALVRSFSYADGSTSAWATLMSPREFLDLTASKAGQSILAETTGPLDPELLAKEGQPIFLVVQLGGEPSNLQKSWGLTRLPSITMGHEGRHRMTALERAGVTRVPVLIMNQQGKVSAEPLSDVPLVPQRGRLDSLNNGAAGATAKNLIPITPENRADLAKLGSGDLMFSLAPTPQPSMMQMLASLPDKIAEGVAKAMGKATAPTPAPEPKPVGQMSDDEILTELSDDMIVAVPIWDTNFVEGSATLTGNNATSSYMVIQDAQTGTEAPASQEADQGSGGEQPAATGGAEGAVAGAASITGPETEGQLELYPTDNLGFGAVPETLIIDGVERPTSNADGNPIAPNIPAVRNFWRWFGDSKAVNDEGQPIVFYRGSSGFGGVGVRNRMSGRRLFFTDNKSVASTYGEGQETQSVLKAYLRLNNIDTYDADGRPWSQVVEEELDDSELEAARDAHVEQVRNDFAPSGHVIERDENEWVVDHPMAGYDVYDNEEAAAEALNALRDAELEDAISAAQEVSASELVELGYLQDDVRTRSTDALAREAEAQSDEDIPDAIWIDDVDDTNDARGISSTVVIVLNNSRNPFNIKNAETNKGTFNPESPYFDQRVGDTLQSYSDQDWPELQRQAETEVFDELAKMKLPEGVARVIGRLREHPKAKGAYNRETRGILIMARLATGASDLRNTARHEAIHYLRANGFFTEEEWRALEAWAKDQKTLLAQVRKNYKGLSEEKMIEEVIAEGFARWAGGHEINVPVGLVQTALKKLADFIRAVLMAMGRRGISHEYAEQVLANAYSGKQVELRTERRIEADQKLISQSAEVRAELAKVREQMDQDGSLETAEEILGKGFWSWTGDEYHMAKTLLDEPDLAFSLLDDPTVPDPSRLRKFGDVMRMTLVRVQNRMVNYNRDQSMNYDPTDTVKRAIKRTWFQERETNEEVARRFAKELGVDTLPPELNYWNQMVADSRGYHIDWFVDNQMMPLVTGMRDRKVGQDELEEFLYAKHAPFRNARIAKINPEMAKKGIPGSGMTDAEAAKIIEDITDAGRLDDFEALASIVYEMNAKAMQHRIEGGLLTQAEADEGFAPDEFYVPLRGFDDMEPGVEMSWMYDGQGGSSGFSVKGPETKRMKGRESKGTDILAYVMAQHMAALDRSYRNQVAQKILAAFEADKTLATDFVDINPIKRVAVWNEAKKQVEYQMQARLNPLEDKRTIYVRRDGKTYRMLFNDKNWTAIRFAAQAKGMPIEKLGPLTVIVTGMTRMFSKLVTTLSVDFWVSNTQADTGFAFLSVASLRKRYPGVFKEYMKALPGVIPALIRAEKSNAGAGLASTDKMDYVNAERELFGGKIVFNQIDDLATAQRRLIIEMRQANRSNINPLKWGRKLLHLIEGITSITDNIHRLALYAALRELGVDPTAAAKEAREVTVNFTQRGAVAKKMNRWYAFANVTMVGAHMGSKVVRRMPVAVGAMFTLGVFYQLMGSAMFGDDWDDFTEEEKQRFFLIPNGQGGAVAWRTPHFFAALITAGRKSTEWVLGGRDPETGQRLTAGEVGTTVALGMVNALSPVQGQSLASMAAPTFADPWVDLWRNENFWGRPIRPEEAQFDPAPNPRWRDHFPKTGAMWVAMARAMSDWTGGTVTTGGNLNFSAESLRYLTNYYTGGPGRTVTGLMDFSTGQSAPSRLPIVRAFIKNPHGEDPDGMELANFNNRYTQLNRIMNTAKDEREAQGPDAPIPFIEENRRFIDLGQQPAGGERNVFQHVRYWRGQFSRAENAMEKLEFRATGQLRDRAEQSAVARATRTEAEPNGIVLPLNRRITPQERAAVLARVRENRLLIARGFNRRYEQAVLEEVED